MFAQNPLSSGHSVSISVVLDCSVDGQLDRSLALRVYPLVTERPKRRSYFTEVVEVDMPLP